MPRSTTSRSILRFHAMRRTLWVTTREVARAAHASSTLKLLAPEHARFVKLLADNGIADGDRWIDEAKRQTLAELHRRGEATARELGLAVPALRHPMVLAPGKSYSTTQGAHTRVLQHLGFDGSIVRSRPVGSWVNSQYRWASMADWIPGGITGMDPSDASSALVDRWLHRFGPATTGRCPVVDGVERPRHEAGDRGRRCGSGRRRGRSRSVRARAAGGGRHRCDHAATRPGSPWSPASIPRRWGGRIA